MQCCLCATNVTDRKKRRKLHGDSAKRFKDALAKLSQHPLDALLETADPDAFLCTVCEKHLATVVDLEPRLTSARRALTEKLSTLTPATCTERQHPGSKRRIADHDALELTAVSLKDNYFHLVVMVVTVMPNLYILYRPSMHGLAD